MDDDLPAAQRAAARVAQGEVARVRRDAVPGELRAPPPDLVHLLPPRRPGHPGDPGVRVGEQPPGPGAAQRQGALRAAAVQVDRHVGAAPRHRAGPADVEQLVDSADERQQPGEPGRGGEHEPVPGVGAAQGPQRGHRGEQVAEPEPAQREQDGAAPRRGADGRRRRRCRAVRGQGHEVSVPGQTTSSLTWQDGGRPSA